MEFKLGELFSGPGGIGWGAKQAKVYDNNQEWKVDHGWANDIDSDACETYTLNICPENPKSVICGPVQDIDMRKLKRIAEIDALAFGFPCNDFSVVGERKGLHGKFGALYAYGVKAVKYFQPAWFLAENVGGLRSANQGNAFECILDELRKINPGYRLTTNYYRFEEYGIPQARHRIIIVGIRKDFNKEFKVPAPTHNEEQFVTAKQAIENPPIPSGAENQEITKQSLIVIERLKHILPGQNVWNAKLPRHLILNTKGARLSQIYRRLDPSKPSYTITGSGGGGTHVYHWKEPRALTNRERARLQTFPDVFTFRGSKESVRRQIGMAVPPEGARIIIEAILKTFAGIQYAYIEPSWKGILNDDSSR
jgi:DNA (cytosine-5)-methyltransferase 1